MGHRYNCGIKNVPLLIKINLTLTKSTPLIITLFITVNKSPAKIKYFIENFTK